MEPAVKASGGLWNALSSFSMASLRWKPTSLDELMEAERKMLSGTKSFMKHKKKKAAGVPFEQELIKLSDGEMINTIKCGQGPPLVLLHGFGAGVGFWVCNLFDISKHNTVYAIDLMGFGRSSRASYSGKTIEDAEHYFVNSIDNWRKAMNLEKFALLGHSFGGYLSGIYALKHPEHVHHLILADPWGIPALPEDAMSKYPLRYRMIGSVLNYITPLSVLRAAGPYGPGLVSKFRSDISRKFVHLYEDPTFVSNYLYQINAQSPMGEAAFQSLTSYIAWAKRPLIDRLDKLPSNIPVTMMYGSHTWMDKKAGWELKEKLGSRASYHTIDDAGHHIYVDNYQQFNDIINTSTLKYRLEEKDSVIDRSKQEETLNIPFDIEQKKKHGEPTSDVVKEVDEDGSRVA